MNDRKPNRAIIPQWQDYETGLEYLRSAGIMRRCHENIRFYRGDQWSGIDPNGLPTPVFNLVRRLVDAWVGVITSRRVSVSFSSSSLDFAPESDETRAVREALEGLSSAFAADWERRGGDALLRDALTLAALTGTAVLYTRYEPGNGQLNPLNNRGIVTTLVDTCDFTAADPACPDLQAQAWVAAAGSDRTEAIRAQAAAYGIEQRELKRLIPDSEDGRTQYILRFSRDEDGLVVWEKCVRGAVIGRGQTGCSRYPFEALRWQNPARAFYGDSPVDELLPNQRYINKAFAMAMKHMTDTAFSKVIYDRKLIPEWTNEVGQAIGVVSGGDVSGAAQVLDTGRMEEGFLEVLDRCVELTKSFGGGTPAALGELDAYNTSAIIALSERADLPLDAVRTFLHDAVRGYALTWAELVCLHGLSGEGCGFISLYADCICGRLSASVSASGSNRYSVSARLSLLDRLLDGGHITAAQYLRSLPEGVIAGRSDLLKIVEGGDENENDDER
ncbi:MAG: hypothetical protein GX628_00700 [Clostridiales bacterium]|nr:hypothetical protein [Clostridiales bacterium]